MAFRSAALACAVFVAACDLAASDACLASNLLFGCTIWKEQYEDICCQVPQHYAEHAGFLSEDDVRFFGRLEEMEAAARNWGSSTPRELATAAGADSLPGVHIQLNNETGMFEWIFYDSQCGMPLFVAPRGRTYAEWKSESVRHGWPSFRDKEVVDGALLLRTGGEVVSACPRPTHLGHRFSDYKGYRYCIDLICIAGQAAADSGPPALAASGAGGAERPVSDAPPRLNLSTGAGAESGARPRAAASGAVLAALGVLRR